MRIFATEKLIALILSKANPSKNVGYGNRHELNKILTIGKGQDHQNFIFSKDEKSFKQYPLIWVVGSQKTETLEPGVFICKNVRLIFSINNSVLSETNDDREIKTFSILEPIVENSIEKLIKYQTVHFEDQSNPKYSFFREPNYSYSDAKESNATIDIWDAIIVEANLIINTNCLTKKEIIECRQN